MCVVLCSPGGAAAVVAAAVVDSFFVVSSGCKMVMCLPSYLPHFKYSFGLPGSLNNAVRSLLASSFSHSVMTCDFSHKKHFVGLTVQFDEMVVFVENPMVCLGLAKCDLLKTQLRSS